MKYGIWNLTQSRWWCDTPKDFIDLNAIYRRLRIIQEFNSANCYEVREKT